MVSIEAFEAGTCTIDEKSSVSVSIAASDMFKVSAPAAAILTQEYGWLVVVGRAALGSIQPGI
jgi:hypothetical protein